MHMNRTAPAPRAFTLIEIMVVIAIIGLLIAVLLPAFSTVRTNARYVQAKAKFTALDTGLNMFRAESALGGTFPPSASDHETDRQLIANPKLNRGGNGGSATVRVAGAHLLVHAMIGANGLGTPGFRDLNRDGFWWDNTHDEEDCGVYYIDPATGKEKHARYGGAGYVDDKMKQSAKSLADLEGSGVILNLGTDADIARDERLFVDPWDTPILYYKPSSGAFRMTRSPSASGIYTQEDNGIITGTQGGRYATDGLDFGAGKVSTRYHAVAVALSPDPTTPIDGAGGILGDPSYDDSFAKFILDPTVRARPTPVRKDSYLLISAGPDARYGTDDDAINWTRTQD